MKSTAASKPIAKPSTSTTKPVIRKPEVSLAVGKVAPTTSSVGKPSLVAGKIATKTTTTTTTAGSPSKGGSSGLGGKIGVGLTSKAVITPAKVGGVSEAAAAKALIEEANAAAALAIIANEATLATELAARAAAEAAEVRLFNLCNGTCCVRYNHYKKILKITNGKLTSEAVDDELSLSFVFKNCKIHLAQSETASGADAEKEPREPIFMKEEVLDDQSIVFCGLESNCAYWACVEENSIEKEAFEKRQAEKIVPIYTGKSDDDDNNGIVKERQESCSCIEGNPCMSPYNCKDWANRFDLAKAHGWRGP